MGLMVILFRPHKQPAEQLDLATTGSPTTSIKVLPSNPAELKVYTVTGTAGQTTEATLTIKSITVTLSQGSDPSKPVIVYPGVTVGVDNSAKTEKVEATVDPAKNEVTVKITTGKAGNPLYSEEVKNVTVEGASPQTATSETVKGYACYPENGHYISIMNLVDRITIGLRILARITHGQMQI